MPALLFDTCCGCIELRSGCLIIGYLNLIGQIILIALGLVGVVGGSIIASSDDPEKQDAGIAVLAISIIVLLILFFLLAFTIVLLVGIHKNKRGHVKAYLVYVCIFIVLSIIMFFASFAGPINAAQMIKQVFSILLSIYFTLVIRSYYYKMDDKRPAVYNTA